MKIRKYELVLVSGEGCIYCQMSKDLLNEEGLGYRTVDYRTFPRFKEDNHLTIPQLYLYNRSNGDYEFIEGGYEGLLKEVDMVREKLHEEFEEDIAI